MPVLVSGLNLQALCTFTDSVGKAIILPDDLALFGGGEDGQTDQYICFVDLTRDMEYIDPISS